MSSGLAPMLPLTVDATFGAYNLITNFETLAQQNLRMLLLTNPGERMMDPEFGVGLQKRLFEQNTSDTYAEIDGNIRSQIKTYLPFIGVKRIDFLIPENSPDLFPHTVNIKLYFRIIPLNSYSMLEIDVGGGSI